MMSRRRAFGLYMAPALVAMVAAVIVSASLGGPVAAAIAGFVALAALLLDTILVLPLAIRRRFGSAGVPIALGTVTYIVSVLLVLLLWQYSGPSQIM